MMNKTQAEMPAFVIFIWNFVTLMEKTDITYITICSRKAKKENYYESTF